MKAWLAEVMARRSAGRLRRDYPDWAAAMAAECDALSTDGLASDDERLGWAAGCVAASFRTPRATAMLGYAGALVLGLCAMGAFQWSQDESVGTLVVLAGIALLLGAVSPRWFLLSGLAVGAVVAMVTSFGALTGIQPDYETTRHGVLHCLRWLVLLAPALLAAAVGREVGLKLRS